jgi:dienelactone hydrolase
VAHFLSVIAALLLSAGIAASQLTKPVFLRAPELPLLFDADSVGGPFSGDPIEIWRPEGNGPFPVVILLFGCGGVSEADREWAARVVGWGYIAIITDSFHPRHVRPTCRPNLLNDELRTKDLLNAVPFLQGYLGVPAERIGVIGFSQGGTAALWAASIATAPLYRAIVSYYAPCTIPAGPPLGADALLLLGADDDPPIATSCDRLIAAQAGTPHQVQRTYYPHAIHTFDRMKGPAAPQSFAAAEAFLAEHLKAQLRAR